GETKLAVQPPSATTAPIGSPVRSANCCGDSFRPAFCSGPAISGNCCGTHMPSAAWATWASPRLATMENASRFERIGRPLGMEAPSVAQPLPSPEPRKSWADSRRAATSGCRPSLYNPCFPSDEFHPDGAANDEGPGQARSLQGHLAG